MKGRDYWSKCTLNLGVVPLFLFAAFLLIPCFFNFAFLIVLVCFVLEPIVKPSFNLKIRSVIITNYLNFVKIIIIMIITPLSSFSANTQESIFMARGEQKSIKINNLKNYSIGNPEILAKKLKLKNGSMLLKGRRVGYTDLVIWKRSGKVTYHIYVLSKRESLKLAQASAVLEELGLSLKFKGKVLLATGEIQNRGQLEKILKIKKMLKNQVVFNLGFSKTFASHTIADIYNLFEQTNISKYFCEIRRKIICHYTAMEELKELTTTYSNELVEFKYSRHEFHQTNFAVQLFFIEVERSDGMDFHLGLDSIAGSLKSYIYNKFSSINENRTLFIGATEYKFKSLAQPKINALLNRPSKIKIGIETPYRAFNQRNEVIDTQWKESGFHFNFELSQVYEKLLFKYDLNYSHQVQERFSKSQQQGEQFIETNKIQELGHINFSMSSFSKNSVPLINKLPLIGKAFSSTSSQKSQKLILVFAKVEK